MSHSFYYIATKCACSNNCMTQMTQICDSIELFLPYGMEILHARTVDYFCLLHARTCSRLFLPPWPSGAKTLRGNYKFKCKNMKLNYGETTLIIITLAGIVTYFAGYNEQISGLKYILARRIWNCLLPPGHCFKLA